jgi:hypothetical protein
MAGATLYDRLGVAPDADLSTLRAAYRGLARRLHPDVVAAGAEPAANLAMALVNEAWRVLSDPTRRRLYDATLGLARPSAATVARPGPAPAGASATGSSPTAAPGAARGGPGSGRGAPGSSAGASSWTQPGPAQPPHGPASRRDAWLASMRLQIRRLGGQAARSAAQTLAIRHHGVPKAYFQALTEPIVAELLVDTEDRVRRARLAGAAPLDLAIGAALLGLRAHAERLCALARSPLPLQDRQELTPSAELVDRMWDTMAHEIPRELELALGGNPRSVRRVR